MTEETPHAAPFEMSPLRQAMLLLMACNHIELIAGDMLKHLPIYKQKRKQLINNLIDDCEKTEAQLYGVMDNGDQFEYHQAVSLVLSMCEIAMACKGEKLAALAELLDAFRHGEVIREPEVAKSLIITP